MSCKTQCLAFAAVLTFLCAMSPGYAAQEFSYQERGKTYEYSVAQTGDNYTFEFAQNPGAVEERLRAVMHVLWSLYDDTSLATRHDYFFMKEGAKCFVFSASLYSYQACFLPNEYSPGKEERFWGYVTRIPNGWWLVIYNGIPAVLGVAVALYFLFR